jgi:hypothetical protein
MKKSAFPAAAIAALLLLSLSGCARQSEPLGFAVMLHLEGELKIPDEEAYLEVNSQLREIIDLFAEHDAKITIESAEPYAEAAEKYGDNLLVYALERGQGTGSHCDILDYGKSAPKNYGELVDRYAEIKEKVDAAVGEENNLGCSGGWVEYDWARAAKEAGFSYLDAPVMLSYSAVPPENRPINPETGKPYAVSEIMEQGLHHDPVPLDFEERIYPRRLKNTNDLEGDGEGILLITGSLGEIKSLHEGRKNCFPGCQLTREDIDYIMGKIDYALEFKDDSGGPVMYLHFPLSTLRSAENRELVEHWLEEMREYAEQGKIEWKTMKEIYEEHSS